MKKTWATINEIICRNKKSNQFPSYIIADNKKIQNTEEAVNILNEYFTTVGTTLASSIKEPDIRFSNYLKQRIMCSFSFNTVNENEILKILEKFKPKTSTGLDGLSMKLL